MTDDRHQLDANLQGELKAINALLMELREVSRTKQPLSPTLPLIDPTANVLSLVSAAITRQDDLRLAENKRMDDVRRLENKRLDDLRKLEETYIDKIDKERHATEDRLQKKDAEAKKAEVDRVDALLAANKIDVALALAKQQAQAEAQDKRIAIVEQNQYQGVGGKTQQLEGRQQSQWAVGVIVTLALGIGAGVMGILMHVLGK